MRNKSGGKSTATAAILFTLLLGTSYVALSCHKAYAKAPQIATTQAVAIMYHRFGEGRYPSTSIRLDQFETHLKILQEQNFNVVPLTKIVAALKSHTPLPPKTIAITVDDAYASVFKEAWPRMKALGWPMTVFTSTKAIDDHRPGYMSWDQIRTLRDAGVTIGAHTKSHAHLTHLDKADALTEIALSNARFQEELGTVPTLFAYPYGEANATTLKLAKRNYDAAFGQQSGVIHDQDNLFYLPRYALNENYGSAERFKMVINTGPIVVRDVIPADPTLKQNPPNFGFTVEDPNIPLHNLRCYGSNPGSTKTEILGNRIEVRLSEGFTGTRGRINCTTMDHKGQWRWYGQLFYIPKKLRVTSKRDD